ncbi:glycosyltransferase family 4 protein [Asaia sp. HN010]|uniref:glycosyltransferase family 4 protein n=1 Tax=Asaia sp. HN010 TaxID=3081233 RepID=UPI00301670AE
MRVLTVLPRREGYAPDRAGAIALLVSRLATPDDIVIGTEVTGTPLPGGQFFAITEPGGLHRWRRDGTRYRIACQREIRRHKPDLIEVHNRPALARALSKCGIPVHLILHNDPQDMHGAKRPRQRQELMQRVRVFTVSFWLRRRFLEDLDDGPVTVMPNCLDLSALPEPPAERSKLVLFAGRMVSDKGADAFVRAWAAISAQAPEWRAIMIGADRFRFNSPRTTFVDRVEANARAAGITLCGYQMHHQVLEAMAAASIVVVPSRWPEPFGLTALEAMASGAAVIASPRGGLPEVVGEAALLALPDDGDALEQALLRMINDSALRAEYMARGREQARKFDLVTARHLLQKMRDRSVKNRKSR